MEDLVNSWRFLLILLVTSLICFSISTKNIRDHLQLSMNGVPATIERKSELQTLPLDWLSGRASFYVKVRLDAGKSSYADSFVKVSSDSGKSWHAESAFVLSKEVIEALLRGEKKQIIFAEDNPRRFIMKGDPFPPVEFGWLGSGVLFGVLFLYSLKLRKIFKLIHHLAYINALSPYLAVSALRISDTSKSAFQSLKRCGIVKETATGLIYLDQSQLNQVTGVFDKFIVISILTMLVIITLYTQPSRSG